MFQLCKLFLLSWWQIISASSSTQAAATVNPNIDWMSGVPTRLLRKQLLVSASEANAIDRLPVYTLTFEIPRGYEFSGRAQPLEDVRIDMGEVVKMVIPNYKPKSYSMSALRKNEFDLTIKIYPNGRASGHLNRLDIGDYTNSFGMRNIVRVRNPGPFFGGIAYGVGITEILPVARAELEKGDSRKVVVLWALRTRSDIFWKDQIRELEEKYGMERFEMLYIFSREKDMVKEDGVIYGRINKGVLRQSFETRIANEIEMKLEDARFLVIGTKAMMRMTEDMLAEIGFPFPQNALFVSK